MPRKKAAKFKCEKCGKVFGMAMHLGRHMTTMHGRAPKAAKAAGPKRGAKAGVRVGRSPGRPAAFISRLGLRAMSLEQLIDVITAAKAEAGVRIAELETLLLPVAPKRPGRPPARKAVATRKTAAVRKAPAKPKRRTRRKFKVSGPDSILAFVKAKGAAGATTAEIVRQWKKERRASDGYTKLGELVKAKKLEKEPLKDQKGSRYTVA